MTSENVELPGRCYWVIDRTFLAGGYPYNPGIEDAEDFLRRLLANGINAFVDLTEEDELTHYQPVLQRITSRPVNYRRFEVRDYSVPEFVQLKEIISHIDRLLEQGSHVYLHCRGGIGRTGTVVGCWLCSHGMSGNEALEHLGGLFSHSNASRYTRSPETEEQRQLVLNYSALCRE